jgi:ATP-dependent DNA ligase
LHIEHAEGDGDKMFKAVCKLGLEGIVSKKLAV